VEQGILTMPRRAAKKDGQKKMVIVRRVADPVFKCKRMLTFNVTRPASDAGTTRTINLNLLPGVSDFTSLFQHYRIVSVQLSWILVNGLNANNVFPTLTVAPQHHSSAVTPLTRDAVSQYHGVKVFQFAPSKNTFTKRFDAYGPMLSVLSGQQYEKAPWYRCEDSTIPYVYAVEFISRYNNTDTPNHTLECVVTADLEFKGTK
jgi:hypothetical protein